VCNEGKCFAKVLKLEAAVEHIIFFFPGHDMDDLD
jgi:hypothetical protein